MTPGSFDPATAREIVGDKQARVIEADANLDADQGVIHMPAQPFSAETYWGQVENEMRIVVYKTQHAKRVARNARKAARTGTPATS